MTLCRSFDAIRNRHLRSQHSLEVGIIAKGYAVFNIDMAGLQMIVFMKGGKSRAQPPPGKELMAGTRLYSVTMALPAIIESDRENSDWIAFSGSEAVIEVVKARNGVGDNWEVHTAESQ